MEGHGRLRKVKEGHGWVFSHHQIDISGEKSYWWWGGGGRGGVLSPVGL